MPKSLVNVTVCCSEVGKTLNTTNSTKLYQDIGGLPILLIAFPGGPQKDNAGPLIQGHLQKLAKHYNLITVLLVHEVGCSFVDFDTFFTNLMWLEDEWSAGRIEMVRIAVFRNNILEFRDKRVEE